MKSPLSGVAKRTWTQMSAVCPLHATDASIALCCGKPRKCCAHYVHTIYHGRCGLGAAHLLYAALFAIAIFSTIAVLGLLMAIAVSPK